MKNPASHTVARSVALAAPPERVFAFATDPQHFPDYVAGWGGSRVTSAEPTGLGVGAGPQDPLTHRQIEAVYRRRAASYDLATQLYRLAGFPLRRYRALAADALELSEGDTVVEIGCGTGANLANLQQRVGPSGRIIGVDMTDAMLEQAERRVRRAGWRNVELVRSDAATFEFPAGIDGILSTLALTLSPDYDRVVERGAAALAPGGRWVILDLKEPEGWPPWLVKLGLLACKPYGVTLGAASRHPWESIERHLPHSRTRELYLGAAYLSVGWR